MERCEAKSMFCNDVCFHHSLDLAISSMASGTITDCWPVEGSLRVLHVLAFVIESPPTLWVKPTGMHECSDDVLEDSSEAKIVIPMISDTQVVVLDLFDRWAI